MPKSKENLRRVRATGVRRTGVISGTGKAQQTLMDALRALHAKMLSDWVSKLALAPAKELDKLLAALKKVGTEWESFVVDGAKPEIQALYTVGYKHGGIETGLGFDPTAADVNALGYLMNEEDGIVPALQGFVEEERQFVETVIRQSFESGTYFDREMLNDILAERL